MKNNTLAIVAIAATVAVLLIATTATSLLTNEHLQKDTKELVIPRLQLSPV